MNRRRLAALAVVVTTMAGAIGFVEMAVRILDGYRPFAPALTRARPPQQAADVAQRYAQSMPVAAGVDRGWFGLSPSPAPPATPDPAVVARAGLYEKVGLPALYEWNRDYLEAFACEWPDTFRQTLGPLGQVFVYDPVRAGEFPTFRYLRNAVYPSGLVTNDFGWRGPNLALARPPRTIRIAFVGASTTAGFHADPASFPEYIGVWLKEWARAQQLDVRFEVINAAREGINSSSIAAVVEQELRPLDVDLVVYYEGANQFTPGSFTDQPQPQGPQRPNLDPRVPWRAERFLALAVRAHSAVDAWQSGTGEPIKPNLAVHWPVDLSESDPSLEYPGLPLNLNTILHDLDRIRASLEPQGGALVTSTFLWHVWPDMKLDRVRNGNVFAYLNRAYWPYSYAHLRRMADFQNRVFTKYATAHGLDLIDVAGVFPRDPDLFADAIHFAPRGGARMQAWVFFNQLVPILKRRLDAGALPRPAGRAPAHHPAFEGPARRLMPVAAFGQSCSHS